MCQFNSLLVQFIEQINFIFLHYCINFVRHIYLIKHQFLLIALILLMKYSKSVRTKIIHAQHANTKNFMKKTSNFHTLKYTYKTEKLLKDWIISTHARLIKLDDRSTNRTLYDWHKPSKLQSCLQIRFRKNAHRPYIQFRNPTTSEKYQDIKKKHILT